MNTNQTGYIVGTCHPASIAKEPPRDFNANAWFLAEHLRKSINQFIDASHGGVTPDEIRKALTDIAHDLELVG